jgi:hypothetical protein
MTGVARTLASGSRKMAATAWLYRLPGFFSPPRLVPTAIRLSALHPAKCVVE